MDTIGRHVERIPLGLRPSSSRPEPKAQQFRILLDDIDTVEILKMVVESEGHEMSSGGRPLARSERPPIDARVAC
jgi:hypothetical protein